MKISSTTYIYYRRPDRRPRPITECIQKVAEAGFDCVDIQFHSMVTDKNHELRGADWEAQVDLIAAALSENRIYANQAHAPFPEYFDPGLKDAGEIDILTRRAFEAAGRLGVKWIVCHPCTIWGEPRSSVLYDANIEHFKPLLEIAGKYGMGLAFENIFDKFVRTSGCPQKKGTPLAERELTARFRTARYFANWPEELVEFSDRLGAYGKTGICWDTGHGNEMMVNQPAALEIIGDRLKALHVNDNFGMQDNHLLPYYGEIEWEPILKALAETGYSGELTLETGAFQMGLPDELITDGMKYSASIARYMADRIEQYRSGTVGQKGDCI